MTNLHPKAAAEHEAVIALLTPDQKQMLVAAKVTEPHSIMPTYWRIEMCDLGKGSQPVDQLIKGIIYLTADYNRRYITLSGRNRASCKELR